MDPATNPRKLSANLLCHDISQVFDVVPPLQHVGAEAQWKN
jgi:hypothetical protein